MDTKPVNPSAPCATARSSDGTLGDVGRPKIDPSRRERFSFIRLGSTIGSTLSTWGVNRSSTHRRASPWLISPSLCSQGGHGARCGSGTTCASFVQWGRSGHIADGSYHLLILGEATRISVGQPTRRQARLTLVSRARRREPPCVPWDSLSGLAQRGHGCSPGPRQGSFVRSSSQSHPSGFPAC